MSQQNIVHEKLPNGSTKLTNEKTGASLVLTADEFALATNRAAAAAKLRPIADPRNYASVRSPAEQVAQERKEDKDPEPYLPLASDDPLGREGGPRAAQRKLHAEWVIRQEQARQRRVHLDDQLRQAELTAAAVAKVLPAPQQQQQSTTEPSYQLTDFDGMNKAFANYQKLKREGAAVDAIAAARAEFEAAAGLPAPQPTPNDGEAS